MRAMPFDAHSGHPEQRRGVTRISPTLALVVFGLVAYGVAVGGQGPRYFDPGDRHQITNTGDGRIELIEVEVRRK
jgi:hypothetical protein